MSDEKAFVIVCSLFDRYVIATQIRTLNLGHLTGALAHTNRRAPYTCQTAILTLVGDEALTCERIADMLDALIEEPSPQLMHGEKLRVFEIDHTGAREVLEGRRYGQHQRLPPEQAAARLK